MNSSNTKKAQQKALIKQILKEDFALVQEAIQEFLEEEQHKDQRIQEVENFIQESFKQYESVFKALA